MFSLDVKPKGQLNFGSDQAIKPSVKTVQLDLNFLFMTSLNQWPNRLGFSPPLTIYILSISILFYLICWVKPGWLILTSLNQCPDWLGADFSNVVIPQRHLHPLFFTLCFIYWQPSIAVWLFVAICVIPSDNVMKGHLEMNDAPCHSLDLSFSISLSAILSFISCLFWTWALLLEGEQI